MSCNFFLPYLKMFVNKLVFVRDRPVQPSLMFASKEPTQMKKISREGRHLALLTNIRLG